jgi:hypothetical protein
MAANVSNQDLSFHTAESKLMAAPETVHRLITP